MSALREAEFLCINKHIAKHLLGFDWLENKHAKKGGAFKKKKCMLENLEMCREDGRSAVIEAIF